MNLRFRSVGMAALFVTVPSLQTAMATLTVMCVPIGGNIVSGGDEVQVECFVATDVFQFLSNYRLDFACVLSAVAGGSGQMTVTDLTADPDGDGQTGPSTAGVPHVFSTTAVFVVNSSLCTLAVGHGPVDPGLFITPLQGFRYVGTVVYRVDDCAHGEFRIILENYSTPPSTADGTQFGEGSNDPIPLQITPTALQVVTGTCCNGDTCHVDNINEFCCQQTYPGARWFEGRTCDDPVPCPDCVTDAECDDGQLCNGQETCNPSTGQCQAGPSPTCDDGVACTVDSCNSVANQCDNVADDDFCDDEFFCNGAETCDAISGQCVPGTPPTCDDGLACTIDSCDVGDNACEHLPDDHSCDDGLFCNGAEACHAAVGCLAGAAPCAPDLLCDEAAQQCTVPPIPTVSQWGLVVLALLLIIAAKLRSRVWSVGAASMT